MRTFSLFWPRTGSESIVIGDSVAGATAATGVATGADAATTVFFPVDFGAGAASRPRAIAVDSSTVFVTERPFIAWNFPRAIDVAKPNFPSAPPFTCTPLLMSACCNDHTASPDAPTVGKFDLVKGATSTRPKNFAVLASRVPVGAKPATFCSDFRAN